MAKQQYCIRVEPQTMEALNSIAMLENRTRSNLIEFILLEFIQFYREKYTLDFLSEKFDNIVTPKVC